MQHWLLDASKMGVPQKRERVFFICLRKDLAEPFLKQMDLFTIAPELNLEFKEAEIQFKEFNNIENTETEKQKAGRVELWHKCGKGEQF